MVVAQKGIIAAVVQIGGPTSVINKSLKGTVCCLKERNARILGARHGINGIMQNDFFRLDLFSESKLDSALKAPGSYLGTSEYRIGKENVQEVVANLKKSNVNYFYMIGGDTTAGIANMIQLAAKEANYELTVVHIPKTIDNDLALTDHSPGYGTAAKYVAMAAFGLDQENRSKPGIYFTITMGRDSGFLAAASSLLRMSDESGPHLIYLPEKHFNEQDFLKDVDNILSKNKSRVAGEWVKPRAFIVFSEGIRQYENGDVNGKHELVMDIAARHFNEKIVTEKMMGRELTSKSEGSVVLANYLKELLKKNFPRIERVKDGILGHIQRSFPIVSDVDALEAEYVGRKAVEFSVGSGGNSGSVILRRTGDGHTYSIRAEYAPLDAIAGKAMQMPQEFICSYGKDITMAFKQYAAPLIGVGGLGEFDKDYLLPQGFDIREIIPKQDRWNGAG